MKYVIIRNGVEIGRADAGVQVVNKIQTKYGPMTVDLIDRAGQFTYMYVS